MNKKGRKDKGFYTQLADRFPDCLYQVNCAITGAVAVSAVFAPNNINNKPGELLGN